MSDKQLIDKSSGKFLLERVSYNNIGIPKDLGPKFKVESKTLDSYYIFDLTNKNVTIHFSRKAFFNPNAFMETNVQMKLSFKLKKEDVTKEEVESELQERADEILQKAACTASMIISVLTSVSLPIPLITPPFLVEQDE